MRKKRFSKARAFVEENRKTLLLIGSVVITGALAFIGCNVLGQSDPEPYATRWYEGLTDDEWQEEREKTRLAMRGTRDEQAIEMESRLRRFDDEWRRRKDDGTDDYVSPPHREHGNNLYKPD